LFCTDVRQSTERIYAAAIKKISIFGIPQGSVLGPIFLLLDLIDLIVMTTHVNIITLASNYSDSELFAV